MGAAKRYISPMVETAAETGEGEMGEALVMRAGRHLGGGVSESCASPLYRSTQVGQCSRDGWLCSCGVPQGTSHAAPPT